MCLNKKIKAQAQINYYRPLTMGHVKMCHMLAVYLNNYGAQLNTNKISEYKCM